MSSEHTGTVVATVARLWRYPVKSMRGEQIDTAVVDERGLIGDRLYAVWDADGRLGSGKNTNRFRRMDGLLDFQTRLTADGTRPTVAGDPRSQQEVTAELLTPDGVRHPVPSPDADEAVRAHLGRDDVHLAIEGQAPHHDAAPLHIVSTATVDWFVGELAGVPADERRLRPNLVLAVTGGAAFVEDGWVGRRLRIGAEADGVVFEVVKPTVRCVMTNAAQDDLPYSSRPLKSLADRRAELGLNAAVVRGGRVRVGDAVMFVG
jgi:uncharacterized protein YcbX